jgi:predicted ester cyclase
MTIFENKLLVQKSASIWVTKDFDLLHEIYDENCIHHQQSKHHNITFRGIDKWRKNIEEFLIKYPDYKEKITNQIAEDDKVVSILECQGSNIIWSGITVDLIRERKIIETWVWFKRIEED